MPPHLLLRVSSYLLVFVFAATQLTVRPALGAMVPTEAVVAAQEQAAARERIRSFLDRADVRSHAEAMGVDPDEARQRVEALSDEEAAWIASRIDALPAGGASFLEVVAAIILVIILIFLVTDLMGFTDVFPFIKPIPRGSAKAR